MEAMSHAESRRLYSWWWNSHISPKNSKWLQENLADTDGKVKAMIRIIEEDADSFARRAEMYYKKRPELMKLVEEFYRAYRALAERYDNATGVLRQAHRTMAVVFPNQVPLEEFSDEPPSGFLATDAEPINSDELAGLFDSEGYDAMEMSGVFAQEIDPESKLFREEIARLSNENREFKHQIALELERAGKAETEAEHLKDEFSKERAEKEDALFRYDESLTRISFLETEISRIQEDLRRLNDELLKEAESLTNSKEKILVLETANQSLESALLKLEISLQDERLRCAESEKHFERMEKRHAESQEELGMAVEKLKEMELTKLSLEEELQKIRDENHMLNEQKLSSTMKIIDLQDEIIFLRELKGKLQDEVKSCREEKEFLYQELCQIKQDRNDLEQTHLVLKEQIRETIQTHESEKVLFLQSLERSGKTYGESQEELRGLQEKLKEFTEKISSLQHDIICLKNLKEKLEDELQLHREEKVVLQLDLSQLKERHLAQKERVQEVTLKMESLEATIKELRDRNDELDEANKKQYSESQEELRGMELVKLSLEEELEEIKQENSRLNEQNLSSTVKIINLQDEIICLRNLKGKLEEGMKDCVGEKEVLRLKMESLRETIKELRDQNDELDETIKKQYSESQEELRGMELVKLSLEDELEKIGQENSRLNEQNLSSTVKIINLQDEIICLKISKGRLEDEMRLRAGEKEVLQLELCRLKGDTDNSEHRHQLLQQQMQAVTSEMESLQEMIGDLKSGNDELKDTIKKHERERILHSQDLKQIQAMSERNAILENSLSDANHEQERLRERIKAHEESCKNLRSKISLDQTEKAVLVSHMDAAARNIEKLLSKNSFLENSLSDANAELDSLKGSLRVLDESCRPLRGQKSFLLSEDTLASKVESISWSLKNLENRFTESEGKCSNLEREKASLRDQVAELQEFLRLEKEKHKALIHSSKNQLNALENQISHLERQSWEMEEALEQEQQRVMNAQLEIFILRRCLHDIQEENLSHSAGLQKQQETLRSAEKLVVELKQECRIKDEKIMCSAQRKEELREWILRIMQTLEIDLKYVPSDGVRDEFLLQLILCEVRHLLNTISETRDEKQILLLEKSVVVTLLEQFGLYAGDLRAEATALNRESKLKKEEFASLKGENNKILETNKQLKEKLQVDSRREELLNAEMDVLFRQLSELQESQRKLQIENSKMSKEKQFLSEKLNELRTKEDRLEEEINVMLAEIMTLDYLSVALKNHLAERGLEITTMNKKVEALELENKQLKLSFANLEECRRFLSRLGNDLNMATKVMNVCEQLNQQTHSGKDLLLEKDSELPQARKNAQGSGVANSELKLEFERTNDVNKLQNKESTDDELESSEAEVLLLLKDIQCATISATLFRQKVIELILTCEGIERSAMLHRKVLHEEIMLKDASVIELKEKVNALEIDNRRLKEELDAYMSLLGTFWDDVGILEEQTLSLGKSNQSSPNKQRKQGNQVGSVHKKSQELDRTYGARSQAGILELQDLQTKIRGLQKLVRDTRSLLELERLDSNASIEAARKEIEALRSNDSRKVKYERIMRDIKLDVVLNSSQNTNNILYHGERRRGNANPTSDHKLELWGTTTTTTEGDSSSNQKQKSPLLIEEVEANHPSSDPVSEKELGVDKLEVTKKMESLLEWHQRITERLSSDAQRLLILQTSLQETHKNMEAFEKTNNLTTTVDLESVRVQLKEAEGSISKLADINSRLRMKAGDLTESSDQAGEKKDGGTGSRSLVSDRAEKMSEKIGKLELDLQKIQCALQKMEQEHTNNKSTRVVEKSGILLKEYIYGKKENRKKRRGCGCMRPKAKGD